ncbi:MAG: 50S ribosomal protein L23 [Candidatus Levybacteria bacterium]|nr:50S ribosomal protein L23 [Candidatus Levybacteria bacterium]
MDIQIKPVITEKSLQDAKNSKFTFAVLKSATKSMIKSVVAKRFSVDVVSIKTSIVKGRTHRVGKKRVEEVMSPWKKAIVAVKQGQKIDLFEVGA